MVQHEKRTKAKAVLINRDADGILERGNVIVGSYLGHSGPKTKVEIGRHRIIIDGVQLKDLANALIDTAEQLDDDLAFYGGAATSSDPNGSVTGTTGIDGGAS